MPGFAPRYSVAQIWDLVQFLHAQSDAAAATTLTNRVQPWHTAIAAPDFMFELAGQEGEFLRQPGRNRITLLVLYTSPQSVPYLNALAAATGTLREVGARVIAIPLSGAANSAGADFPGNGSPIVAIAPADAITVYEWFAREEGKTKPVAPAQVDYLIDRQGYVRARWIGVPDSPLDRVAETFDQSEVLSRERPRVPSLPGHRH